MLPRSSHVERFWAKVEKTGSCWLWIGARKPTGYGNLTRNKRHELAHRVSWEMANGPVPNGLQVLHRCDVRNCVNPEHLFLGTAADNMADMRSKSRQVVGDRAGERNGRARLSGTDVELIRLAAETLPVSHAEIASAWNVSAAAVGAVVRRESWAHIG